MIWIDLKNKKPTDSDIPGWLPWTNDDWEAWLERSKELVDQLSALEAAGHRKERNDLIDASSGHWGKLKQWLLALSGQKCWFSETKNPYFHYDVEHFRPKKEAKELDPDKHRDGYWWLAFDYMNLRACGTVGNRKKGGWFPLRPHSQCSTFAHQCEEAETPYLIDPIDEQDVSLLAFDEEGKAVPVPGATDWERERVEQTIKRLKLNEHEPLSEARRKVWQAVDREISTFQKAKERCVGGPNPAALQQMRDAGAQLRKMADRQAELSSVAKWSVLLRNDPQLSRLVS